jgi:predicted RNA-binding Zn ribbon-like protein
VDLPSREEQLDPKPAPPALQPLQAFLNTRDSDEGWDLLDDPETARTWLSREGLAKPGARIGPALLEELREIREALRALLRQNNAGPAPTSRQLAVLRRLASSSRPQLEIDRRGRFGLGISGQADVRAALVAMLLAARDAQTDGSWSRLKACGNDECGWAFFDRSRNRQGSWCDMAVCGNRLKNRSFRARQR